MHPPFSNPGCVISSPSCLPEAEGDTVCQWSVHGTVNGVALNTPICYTIKDCVNILNEIDTCFSSLTV